METDQSQGLHRRLRVMLDSLGMHDVIIRIEPHTHGQFYLHATRGNIGLGCTFNPDEISDVGPQLRASFAAIASETSLDDLKRQLTNQLGLLGIEGVEITVAIDPAWPKSGGGRRLMVDGKRDVIGISFSVWEEQFFEASMDYLRIAFQKEKKA